MKARRPLQLDARAVTYLWNWALELSDFARTALSATGVPSPFSMSDPDTRLPFVELRHWNGVSQLRVWVDRAPGGQAAVQVRLERPLSRIGHQVSLRIPRAVMQAALAPEAQPVGANEHISTE